MYIYIYISNTTKHDNKQCQDVLGVTKKKLQCKLQASNDAKYCHYHAWQSSNAPIPKQVIKKPGFIYIYTYEHMYNSFIEKNPSKRDFIRIDNSIISPSDNKNVKWDDDTLILCKIGMTTKSEVNARLLEWRKTCKHPITNLTPDKVHSLMKKKKSLTRMFQKLSLKSKKDIDDDSSPQFYSYNKGGFYSNGKGPRTLLEIENTIHKLLWNTYGQGLVYCYGCDPKNGEKRHREWFCVPKNDLLKIMKYIDNLCKL